MQDTVTYAGNARNRQNTQGANNFSYGLRSVTKIVKTLNTLHNSELLTFKTVSDWLVQEGYWAKTSGKTVPTEKGLENGMSLQNCCLNGKEFTSVYCDKKMQKIISDKFSSLFCAQNAPQNTLPPDGKMAATWQQLGASYYAKGSYKEAAECYLKAVDCLK